MDGGAACRLMPSRWLGIAAYVCEGGEVPLTAALVTMGVGIGPAFTFMQASRRHLPANSDDAGETHRCEVDSSLSFLLVGVFGRERNPRGMESVI
jgi:hypothetical protein